MILINNFYLQLNYFTDYLTKIVSIIDANIIINLKIIALKRDINLIECGLISNV